MKRIRKWISIRMEKNPSRLVLLAILFFNIAFLVVSALIIDRMALTGTEDLGFFGAAFYTITMILDAGCVQFVVEDIGQTNATIAIACLIIIIVGMVSFTGAVIGYISNYIANFIENAHSGSRRLKLYDHFIILNWNSRAAEIINDLLYCEDEQTVVVFVEAGKDKIENEISDRLMDTVNRENGKLFRETEDKPFLLRNFLMWKNKFKNRVTVIVREGDLFSSKQLHDIAVQRAKSIIILGMDRSTIDPHLIDRGRRASEHEGNIQTIKTLMQVAEITSSDYSNDHQRIVVEVSDNWTMKIVESIITYKQVNKKCNIVPIKVHEMLGFILSQFSITPELNLIYNELLSNKDTTFFEKQIDIDDDVSYISEYLRNHECAIPLASMKQGNNQFFFYSADQKDDIEKESAPKPCQLEVKLNPNYHIEEKNVIILGHNSKCREIMKGFSDFNSEWKYEEEDRSVLRVVVIDDEEHLKQVSYYKEYGFVTKTVASSIYEKETICTAIEDFFATNGEDVSIVILSNDEAMNEEVDAEALTNLVYVHEIIRNLEEKDPNFKRDRIDVIVEIIDPKHFDVINDYSFNNVVISNRYISKMITQIGEKDAIFNFYNDVLSFDSEAGKYESKEIYAKRVSMFFEEIPRECTVYELIRAVWTASCKTVMRSGAVIPAIPLGWVEKNGTMHLFNGKQSDQQIKLSPEDRIILYTPH